MPITESIQRWSILWGKE